VAGHGVGKKLGNKLGDSASHAQVTLNLHAERIAKKGRSIGQMALNAMNMHDVDEHEFDIAPWRHSLLHFVHSKPISTLMTLLLVLDVILTLVEFVISHKLCDYEMTHRLYETTIDLSNATVSGGGHRRSSDHSTEAAFHSTATSFSYSPSSGYTHNMEIKARTQPISLSGTVSYTSNHELHEVEVYIAATSLGSRCPYIY